MNRDSLEEEGCGERWCVDVEGTRGVERVMDFVSTVGAVVVVMVDNGRCTGEVTAVDSDRHTGEVKAEVGGRPCNGDAGNGPLIFLVKGHHKLHHYCRHSLLY